MRSGILAVKALEPGSKPTNMEESWYNPADEIIVVVIRKRPGSAGASFLEFDGPF
jgi:hypothetical protein